MRSFAKKSVDLYAIFKNQWPPWSKLIFQTLKFFEKHSWSNAEIAPILIIKSSLTGVSLPTRSSKSKSKDFGECWRSFQKSMGTFTNSASSNLWRFPHENHQNRLQTRNNLQNFWKFVFFDDGTRAFCHNFSMRFLIFKNSTSSEIFSCSN